MKIKPNKDLANCSVSLTFTATKTLKVFTNIVQK